MLAGSMGTPGRKGPFLTAPNAITCVIKTWDSFFRDELHPVNDPYRLNNLFILRDTKSSMLNVRRHSCQIPKKGWRR